MIEKYQELLNDCIDAQEDNKILQIFKKLEVIMKGKMEMLKKKGKHTQESYIQSLEDTINCRDREIHDIKQSCAEEFKHIKSLCFCNECNGMLNKTKKLNKIFEIASDNYSMLIKDLEIENDEEPDTKAKIIELPKTDQSAR